MAIRPAGRGPELIAVYSSLSALTTITTVLRGYCRIIIVKSFGLDDWLTIAAWLTFVGTSACAITATFYGLGQHNADIQPQSMATIAMKWWWICEPTYIVSTMTVKASIAVLLLRLTVTPLHRIIIWVTLLIIEVFSFAMFFTFIFQCVPPQFFWTRFTGATGSCMDPKIIIKLGYAYSGVTCITDWIFAILPIFLVLKLQMNSRTKAMVALILAMGVVASIATIIRIPHLQDIKNIDFLYATHVGIWSAVETGLGITAAGAATMRPLLRTFLGRSKYLSYGRRHTGSNAWRTGNMYFRGFVRSPSKEGTEEIKLKDSIIKTVDVKIAVDESGSMVDVDAGSTSSKTAIISGKGFSNAC